MALQSIRGAACCPKTRNQLLITTTRNCILWGNNGYGGQILNEGGTTTVSYSVVQGGYPGTGNLSADPLFVVQPPVGVGTAGDLRLQACSPAIDAGNDSDNSSATDPDGNDRKFDAIAGGRLIDMGAYESPTAIPTPTLTCPANIVRSADLGQCDAVVNYSTPSGVSICSVELMSGGASNSTFLKGTSTVTWQAVASGNVTLTCAFTVTVNDNQPPSITCPANQTVGNTPGLCSATVNYATPAYSDNCTGGGAALQSGPLSGGIFPKGQTTVIWRATDAVGLTKTCSFRVTVNDTEAPAIICPTVTPTVTMANACVSAPITYSAPTATDNCTGAVTLVRIGGPASGSSFPMGTTNVTWRAIDASGRSSTCSFSVTVMDATSPIIACPQNVAVTGGGNPCVAMATYTTPTATDNCGVQLVSLVNGLASGSQFPSGATVNTWRAVDNSGLSSTCSFTVTVSCGANSEQGGISREQLSPGLIPEISVKEILTLGLSLFPNPAQDEVQVSIENLGATGGELALHDSRGRVMMKQRIGIMASPSLLLTLPLTDFPAGLYFVTLQTAEGKKVTKRLVKAVD